MRLQRNVKAPPTNSVARSEDELPVGKRLHVSIGRHNLEVAHGGRGSLEEASTDSLLRRRVFAAALEPRLEVVSLADHLLLLDVQAGLFAKRDPVPLGIGQ